LAIGIHYVDFYQLSDDEVVGYLAEEAAEVRPNTAGARTEAS
jgi:predicted phosphoribosyltransferase